MKTFIFVSNDNDIIDVTDVLEDRDIRGKLNRHPMTFKPNDDELDAMHLLKILAEMNPHIRYSLYAIRAASVPQPAKIQSFTEEKK